MIMLAILGAIVFMLIYFIMRCKNYKTVIRKMRQRRHRHETAQSIEVVPGEWSDQPIGIPPPIYAMEDPGQQRQLAPESPGIVTVSIVPGEGDVSVFPEGGAFPDIVVVPPPYADRPPEYCLESTPDVQVTIEVQDTTGVQGTVGVHDTASVQGPAGVHGTADTQGTVDTINRE